MVGAESAPEDAPVALQRGIEFALVEEGGAGLLDQPLGGLESPAAADPEQGVGGERRVAHEREPGRLGGRILFGISRLPISFESRSAPPSSGPSGIAAAIRR